jgi:ubiquinone/menaquinone biosynthesis C-methylase UbiE
MMTKQEKDSMRESEVLREWRESAPFWEKHAEAIRQMFAPLTEALIAETGIEAGQNVLDVAGGAGEPALTIAEIVGAAGSVAFTDAVAEMVSAAKRAAQKRGLKNITFRQAAAENLPFADDSFDAAVCRLGVMFFANPQAGMREMLRVTKPKAKLSFVVWHKSEHNPFSYVVTDALSRHSAAEPAKPANMPGAFRFEELDVLAGMLRDAGAVSVSERILEFQIKAPFSPEEFWTLRSEMSGSLREKLSALAAEEKNLIKRESLANARQFFPGNQMNFPAQMIVVTGEKPL